MEIHGQFMTIHGDIPSRRQPRSARRSEQHESTEGWCAISEHPSKLMSLMFFCLKQKIPRLRGFAALRLPFGLPFGREHYRGCVPAPL